MSARCRCQKQPRAKYRGPLVIRTPYGADPDKVFDVAASFDRDRAARRRRDREEAWRRSLRGRAHRALAFIRTPLTRSRLP